MCMCSVKFPRLCQITIQGLLGDLSNKCKQYHKPGKFCCKIIFVVDRSYEIKITKLKRMCIINACQRRIGSFLRKIFNKINNQYLH